MISSFDKKAKKKKNNYEEYNNKYKNQSDKKWC